MNMPDYSRGRSEESEPVAAQAAGPVGLIILLGVLFFFGTLHMDRQGGNFNAGVYRPYLSSDDLTNYRPVRVVDPLWAKGAATFGTFCAPCHQKTGVGAPGLAPPLNGSEWVLDEGPNRIIRLVLNGLKDPITVKGTEWNLVMPPWKDSLDDESIAAVVTYIRGNKDWGHSLPGATKEEVAAIRKSTGDRSDSWTAAQLKTIPAK